MTKSNMGWGAEGRFIWLIDTVHRGEMSRQKRDLETMEKHCLWVSHSGLLSCPSYTAQAHLSGMLRPTVDWVLAHKPARKKTPHSQAPWSIYEG